MTRDTRTGSVLERMILPSLDQGGYSYRLQVPLGNRPGGGRHMVDAVATKASMSVLLSVKWQQVSGTAEQKVPFEVICLLAALDAPSYHKAYLVLGGEGWTLRDFYTSGGLSKYISYGSRVDIVTLEAFIGRANAGRL